MLQVIYSYKLIQVSLIRVEHITTFDLSFVSSQPINYIPTVTKSEFF